MLCLRLIVRFAKMVVKTSVSLEDDVVKAVEDWRAKQRPIPSFSQAVNILLRKALKTEEGAKR